MVQKKQGIDWTTLWKKDDWVSVWIGFAILITFIIGCSMKLPGCKWMTDGAFVGEISSYTKKVDGLVKEAETKGEEGLKGTAAALKSALDAKDRQGIAKAAGSCTGSGTMRPPQG